MPKFNPLKDIPSLSGKVAIVTGGNRGMGFHLTQQLANHGAKVYLAARSEDSAQTAISRIESENPTLQGQNRIVFLQLDLGTLDGARRAAEQYLTRESRVDILIHNAALMSHGYEKTADGVEDCFAVNHLAPFVFTQGLLPLLISTSKEPDSDVRVVTIASAVHSFAPSGGKFLTLEEINDPLGPVDSPNGIKSRYARYARSKLANILFVKELQKHLDDASSPAVSTSVDPGGVATDTVLTAQNNVPLVGPLLRFAISKLARSPLDGAATALFAATSPDVARRRVEFKGAFVSDFGAIGQASKDGENLALAGKLWAATAEMSAKILSDGSGSLS
ncbi:NAD(P)-binding protein [Mycena rosella]|uniref:NAD(P)-binding protein n=1 Tax=Mycena rosella TaxID=1033263 RepID=A0AAD7CU36_MYCRO|nr:NAD(P)-binding protein [Mycena rosella]